MRLIELVVIVASKISFAIVQSRTANHVASFASTTPLLLCHLLHLSLCLASQLARLAFDLAFDLACRSLRLAAQLGRLARRFALDNLVAGLLELLRDRGYAKGGEMLALISSECINSM